ncbi:MAG: hypothetical protein K5989_03510 [Lachnospiraceae bacterium]|nr:hypothetical protein [Lachnospiraceae bacterium]
MRREILRFSRVTYKEDDKVVLRDFELDILEGEIMGLIPLNAYGLDAFLDILRYNSPIYFGDIYYMGSHVNSWQDMKRLPNKITVIDDHNSLVAGQDLLTNIFLIGNGSDQFIIRKDKLEKKLIPYLQDIGENISPYKNAEDLSSFERVVVELIRAVISGHKLIVLKELDSYIGENWADRMYEIISHYRERGISFLIISGNFDRMKNLCDRTAFMSNGKILNILEKDRMDTLAKENSSGWMKKYRKDVFKEKDPDMDWEQVLTIKDISGRYISNTDLVINKGEYLVLYASDKQALDELSGFLFGQLGGEKKGRLKGKEISLIGHRKLAFLKENADESMLFPEMSYMDNLLFNLDQWIEPRWGRKGIFKSVRQEFSGILGPDVFEKKVDSLTQRERITLIYARVFLQRPEVLFCVNPFKDADIAMRLLISELHALLNSKGIAIVSLTMNTGDTFPLADRILRLDKGIMQTVFPAAG